MFTDNSNFDKRCSLCDSKFLQPKINFWKKYLKNVHEFRFLILNCNFVFWTLKITLLCFSWMAWLGDHSWRRWRRWWSPPFCCSWWWWWWWWWCWWWWCWPLPCSCWCQPSEPSVKKKKRDRIRDLQSKIFTSMYIFLLKITNYYNIIGTIG